MSGYLLDTNYVSELVSVQPDPHAASWVERVDEKALYLRVLTLGEIRKGIAGSAGSVARRARLEQWLALELPKRFAGRILSVDANVADLWGRLSGELKRSGTPVSTVDALLAATAFHHHLVVVRRNVRDFEKTGVPVLNPWE